MSPRALELVVEDFQPRRMNRSYLCRVLDVTRTSPTGLLLVLRDLDEDQRDRETACVLPLPVRVAGTTCEFFRACGQDVSAGAVIRPREAIGAVVQVRFGPDEAGHVVVPQAFNTQEKKDRNDAR